MDTSRGDLNAEEHPEANAPTCAWEGVGISDPFLHRGRPGAA